MAKFTIHKTKDYTVMSNHHLREKNMSLKAKGLLSLMLSLPDDWGYSIEGLVAICKENETAIKSTLDEVKAFGYLEVTKLMPNQTESGRIEYVYNVYENPKQEGEKQGIEILPLEILPLAPNNSSYTKIEYIEQSKEDKDTKKEIKKKKGDVVLSVFSHWNEANIIKHRDLTPDISKAIEKALKVFTEEEIKTYIDRYAKVIGDASYFWHYKWRLVEFLSRKDGISSFTDEGSKWVNYQEHLAKPRYGRAIPQDEGKWHRSPKPTDNDDGFPF